MSFREQIRKAYLKHLGTLLASALIIFSVAIVATSYYIRNRWGFWHDILLNLGPEIFGMAITIGLVDYLFARRSKLEHQRAVEPRVRDLLMKLHFVQAAYANYLTGINKPPPDLIERYMTALKETITTAVYIVTLVDEQQPDFAGLLTRLINEAQPQFLALSNAAAAVRYESDDVALHVGKIRADAEQLFQLSDQVRSQIVAIYEPSIELQPGNSK
jgi:hypothetical protein